VNYRTLFGTLGVVSLVVAPLGAEAQPAAVPRIGLLAPTTCSHPNYQALREGLRALGYVDGQTIVIECREAGGRYDQVAQHAAELVQLKVDVLVTDGLPAARAAKQATKTIPVVMGAVGDPVGGGVVNSLARPGANITGLTLVTAEMNAKRLEFLKAAVPGSTRVAVLMNPDNPSTALGRRGTEAAARSLGLTLHAVEARGPEDLDRAFSEMLKGQARAVVVLPDPMLFAQRIRIVALAAKGQLPAIGEAREFAADGGFMAYGPRITENFRRAAVYVERILKGAKPGDLPVEQPTTFELVINLKTAKALGLSIPQSLLLRADEVIQ
jgi:putative tryptophan/tyrosine transport system substrate-binding protein